MFTTEQINAIRRERDDGDSVAQRVRDYLDSRDKDYEGLNVRGAIREATGASLADVDFNIREVAGCNAEIHFYPRGQGTVLDLAAAGRTQVVTLRLPPPTPISAEDLDLVMHDDELQREVLDWAASILEVNEDHIGDALVGIWGRTNQILGREIDVSPVLVDVTGDADCKLTACIVWLVFDATNQIVKFDQFDVQQDA